MYALWVYSSQAVLNSFHELLFSHVTGGFTGGFLSG